MLLGDIGEKEYMGSKGTYGTVNENFKQAFSKGFPFEILEVQSDLPVISCTWRHWADHAGPYQAADGTIYKTTGKRIELFSQGVIKVTVDLQITELQMSFDKSVFIKNSCPADRSTLNVAVGMFFSIIMKRVLCLHLWFYIGLL